MTQEFPKAETKDKMNQTNSYTGSESNKRGDTISSPKQLPVTLISQSQRLICQDSFLVLTHAAQGPSLCLPVMLILNNMSSLESDGDRKHLKWSPQWDNNSIFRRFMCQHILYLIHSIYPVPWKCLNDFHLLTQFPSSTSPLG